MTKGRPSPAGAPEEEAGQAPEGRIRYLCMKYNAHQEGERAACRDPHLYCKYRPACLINYQEKQRRRPDDAPEPA